MLNLLDESLKDQYLQLIELLKNVGLVEKYRKKIKKSWDPKRRSQQLMSVNSKEKIQRFLRNIAKISKPL